MPAQIPGEYPSIATERTSAKLSVDLSGWDLVEKLHSVGVDDPAELARVLEEEDPFKVTTYINEPYLGNIGSSFTR